MARSIPLDARRRPAARRQDARAAALAALLLSLPALGCGGAAAGDDGSVGLSGGGGGDGSVAADADATAADAGGLGAADIPGASDAPGADTAAASCQSDKDCLAAGQVCHKPSATCVACVSDDDCDGDHSCKGLQCVPPAKPCKSSKDCADRGQVCAKAAGVCVGCASADDCGAGEVCVDTVCAKTICIPGQASCANASTRSVCAADGLSAATTACPGGGGCVAGKCTAASACKPGATQCAGAGTLETCTADGSGWQGSPCPSGKLCMAASGVFGCSDADCDPGAKVCFGAKVAECTATGQIGEVWDDCGAQGKLCKDGACVAMPADPVCKTGATGCADPVTAQVCDASGNWKLTPCAKGQGCAAGVCAATPTTCVAGAKTFLDATTVGVCAADGASQSSQPCPGQTVCKDGVCVAALCSPGAVACVDDSTQKVCAADGGQWTGVAACPAPGPCSTSSCQAGKGCVSADAADGAVCGAGKVCAAGACVVAQGCAACGPGEACVDGACKACAPLDSPKYTGSIVKLPLPAAAKATLTNLGWSALHGEWWLSSLSFNNPSTVTRYDKAFQPTGASFATYDGVRTWAILPDGGYVYLNNQTSGSKQLRRAKALGSELVWSVDTTFLKAAGGVCVYKGQLLVSGTGFGDGLKTSVTTVDLQTGKAGVTVGTGLSTGIGQPFAIGDVLWSASTSVGAVGLYRWLLAPTFGLIAADPSNRWPYALAGLELRNVAFDGKRVCLGVHTVEGQLFCYDMFQGCGATPKVELPFADSMILLPEQQAPLAAALNGSKVWQRCGPKGAPIFQGFAEACGKGPTVLLFALASPSGGAPFVAAVYTSKGWPGAGASATDPDVRIVRGDGTVKAVPSDGQATVTVSAAGEPSISGAMTCNTSGCTFPLSKFVCSDGSAGANCVNQVLPGAMANLQHAYEAFVQLQ